MKRIRFLCLLLLAVTSCGYHFSGTGEIIPRGAKTISVPVFFNGTNEPYIDVEVTQAVVEEFLVDGRLRVAGLEEAELALRGKVVKYEALPVAYTAANYVQQYRVRLVIDAALEDLRSKKILWSESGMESSFISEYAVFYDSAGGADIRLTKNAKETAIKKASQDMAWTLRSRILEGF
jgi:outer membrane lipopolysaccharide assembly protein LptE/RlpB